MIIARQGLLALRLALLALAARAEPHASITFGCSDANLTEGFECALRPRMAALASVSACLAPFVCGPRVSHVQPA